MKFLRYLIREIKKNLGPVSRLPAPCSWSMIFPGRSNTVQRLLLLEYLKAGYASARLMSLMIALIFWPWKSIDIALRMTRLYAGQVAHERKPSVQFLQQIYFAWFHGISPAMYYQMGMVASRRGVSPSEWIQSGHAALLTRIFTKNKELIEINDKFVFYLLLKKKHVKVIPVLAVYESGQSKEIAGERSDDFTASGNDEIFVKPCRSSRGQGASIWRCGASGQWSQKVDASSVRSRPGMAGRQSAASLSPAGLVAHLAEQSMLKSLLVQPRIVNHPDIAAIFGNGLMSIRVLSGIADGEVRILRTVSYAPALQSITSQTGFIVEVDRDSGTLGRVFNHGPDQIFAVTHPQTGVVIQGVRLPCWEELLLEVSRAHRALADYAFLAWDAAISPQGPVIIEANGNFETHSLQRPGSKPLIDDEFLSIFESWQDMTSESGGRSQ